MADGAIGQELLTTGRRAVTGLLLAVVVGSAAGMLAGLAMTAAMMSRPQVTVLWGTPPIAWLVLAMQWFGGSITPRALLLPPRVQQVDASLEHGSHLEVPLASTGDADLRKLADRDLSAASTESVLVAPSLQSGCADLDEQAPPSVSL